MDSQSRGKAHLVKVMQDASRVIDALGLCKFVYLFGRGTIKNAFSTLYRSNWVEDYAEGFNESWRENMDSPKNL